MHGNGPAIPETSGMVLVESGVILDCPTCGQQLFNCFQGLLKPWKLIPPHIYVCAHAYTFMQFCLYTPNHAYTHLPRSIHRDSCMYVCIHTCIYTCIDSCMSAYIYTCMHTYMHANINTLLWQWGWMPTTPSTWEGFKSQPQLGQMVSLGLGE